MGKSRATAAVVLLLGGLALSTGCGSKSPTRINIQDGPVGQGNGITPAELSVPRNAEVEFKVTNTATKTHGFSVEGYDVVKEIPAGESVTVKFTASRSGTFKVFCQLHPSHAPAELTVN
ncbi:MAG: hypothetical protein NVS3B21_22770 [Acidimicrobiales bacterium]